MHSTNRALLLRLGLIDLGNGFLPTGGSEFFGAEKAREVAAAIAKLLPFDDLETGDWGVEDSETAHFALADSQAAS